MYSAYLFNPDPLTARHICAVQASPSAKLWFTSRLRSNASWGRCNEIIRRYPANSATKFFRLGYLGYYSCAFRLQCKQIDISKTINAESRQATQSAIGNWNRKLKHVLSILEMCDGRQALVESPRVRAKVAMFLWFVLSLILEISRANYYFEVGYHNRCTV